MTCGHSLRCRILVLTMDAMVLLLTAASSWASPTLGTETWGNGSNTMGWISRDEVATSVTSPGTGGNSGGYVMVHFAAPQYPGMEHDYLINRGPDYTGDYTGLNASFDFMGYPSSALALYFQSSANGGSTWVYDFVVPSTAWTSVQVSFVDSLGWTRVSGSAELPSAITEISEIGFSLQHLNNGMSFDYGVDNWTLSDSALYVPEPGSIVLLLAVALSMVAVFRTQVCAALSRLWKIVSVRGT